MREIRAMKGNMGGGDKEKSSAGHNELQGPDPPRSGTSTGSHTPRTVQFVGGVSGEFWVSPIVPAQSGQRAAYFGAPGPTPTTRSASSRNGSRTGSGWNSPAADDVR